MIMNFLKHILSISLILNFSFISSCGHTFTAEEKEFDAYSVIDSSTFPTTTITLKSKSKGTVQEASPSEILDQLEFDGNSYEMAMLEITDQIKYWFYLATAIGVAGAAVDEKSSSDFLILGGIGLVGSIVAPIYQTTLTDKLKEESQKKPTPESQVKDSGEDKDKTNLDVNTSDF
jgi:hypothetical protein